MGAIWYDSFDGLFSRTTWVSGYQKGKRGNRWWGFGMQWHQLDYMHMQLICSSVQADSHTSQFLEAECCSCRQSSAQPTVSKRWRLGMGTISSPFTKGTASCYTRCVVCVCVCLWGTARPSCSCSICLARPRWSLITGTSCTRLQVLTVLSADICGF